MKRVKKLSALMLIFTLTLISMISIPESIYAEDLTNSSAITVPEDRIPYIDKVRFGPRNSAQRLLYKDTLNTDVEYSTDYNTIYLTFKHHKDDKANISLNSGVLAGIMLYASGTSENLIDFDNTDTELTRGDGEYTLTIRTFGLNTNTEYYLIISEGLVSLTITDSNDPSKTATAYSPSINIHFKTRTSPYVDAVITGSVSENYDEREPIIITGKDFNDIVSVYFNDIPAYDVVLVEGSGLTETYLKVYLPRGRNRLDVGTYDITVSNGSGHETVLLSAFSVIKEGNALPTEKERPKSKLGIGNIVESLGVSDTTLNLASKYTDTTSLQIDSDDIFGKDTLIRRIKYRAYKEDVINWLNIKSTRANISLSNVRPSSYDKKSDIEIILGSIDPYKTQLLREKLKGVSIKSDFINISGSGYSTSSIELSIPYRDSDGTNLKVLRYDEANRRWEEEAFYVDKTENRVNIYTNNQGIFVVVEYEH